MNEQLDKIADDIKLIKHYLTGNGSPERGLIVRVDRLEQSDKSRSKWIGAALVAGIGAAVTTVWHKLFGG